MDWRPLLAYITGSVDQELLRRNECLVTENRILRQQIKGRIQLSDGERKTLAEIGLTGLSNACHQADQRSTRSWKPALQTARQRQETSEFKAQYALRAGWRVVSRERSGVLISTGVGILAWRAHTSSSSSMPPP
jgi:hypothetical protein